MHSSCRVIGYSDIASLTCFFITIASTCAYLILPRHTRGSGPVRRQTRVLWAFSPWIGERQRRVFHLTIWSAVGIATRILVEYPSHHGAVKSPCRESFANTTCTPGKSSATARKGASLLNHARFIRRAVFPRIILSCCVLPICSAATSTAAENPQTTIPPKQRFHLFLMVGQSNMAGRGRVSEADRQPLRKVLVYSKNGSWIAARAPLHFDKPNVVGVGIGRAFAKALRQANPDCTVGLIPCAVGGSPISAWQPGGFHRSTNTHPWDDMLRRARAALPAGTLKGILWHQGESDCQPDLAARYQDRLHTLIQRFRHELQAPTVPFLAGQMGQFPERPWDAAKKHVDAAHRGLPANVAHTAFVSSHGLTHKGDEVHFDTKSYRELGRRYARAWLKLRDCPP